MPITVPTTGYGIFRRLSRISENSGRAYLSIPVHIAPEISKPQSQWLLIEAMEHLLGSLVVDPLGEVADGAVVEDLFVNGQKAEPSKCDIL